LATVLAPLQVKQLMGKMEDRSAPVECLYEAQRIVERRLEQKWLSEFTATPDFIARQRPTVSVGHVVDDVIAARRRRTTHTIQRVSLTHISVGPIFT